MGGVGIKSMGTLMDRVMSNILPHDPDALERVIEGLKPLKDQCAWTKGTWDRLNGLPCAQLQNTGGHIRLLSNMLIRVYTGVE
jgi:hypothetical protein